MTIPGIIFTGILVAVALAAIAFPLIQQRKATRDDSAEQKARDELLTSYERVLATIRDLDEDHQTGKLDTETYQRERGFWTEQGILLLQELDPDTDPEPEEKPATQADKALDDAIEQAIAAYRQAEAKS